MFALFFSLYNAMFTGTWNNYALSDILNNMKNPLNSIGQLVTSIFGDTSYTTLGTDLIYSFIFVVSFVLALITSIGIVVMAVKGIKRVFSIFFAPIR